MQADCVTDLILIRHGETDWNRARRFQGHQDIALNEEGVRQAQGAARRLAQRPQAYGLARRADRPDPVLVTSDLLRCRQTAEPIAASLGLTPVLDAGFRERSFGVFEGLTVDELRRDHAEPFARWLAREPDFAIEGAESLRVFAGRIQSALDGLMARHGGRTVVVVTHGGVLDIVWRIGHGMPLDATRKVDIANASLNRLRHSQGRLEVVDWGDVSHWRDRDDNAPAGVQAP
jgi:probable phosphoglycerate mutase